MALTLDGHTARIVHDGPAALGAVQAFAPDVVLLEYPAQGGRSRGRREGGRDADQLAANVGPNPQSALAGSSATGFFVTSSGSYIDTRFIVSAVCRLWVKYARSTGLTT
jgi:hypothetical protein